MGFRDCITLYAMHRILYTYIKYDNKRELKMRMDTKDPKILKHNIRKSVSCLNK